MNNEDDTRDISVTTFNLKGNYNYKANDCGVDPTVYTPALRGNYNSVVSFQSVAEPEYARNSKGNYNKDGKIDCYLIP